MSWQRLLVEPARPRVIARRENAYWLAVGAVCVGAFMGQLDASIVTLAFPTIERDMGVSVGAVQWVGLSYLLMLAVALAAVGRYADMVGRKLLYTYGFIVFIAGSALCGFAHSLELLVAFRLLQALGAAMLQANSVAIIVSSVPKPRLGRAIGVQGAAQALGLAFGPVAGGLLIAVGGWRLIFFVNVPLGLVATALAWLFIPRSRELAERAAFDWHGLALFIPVIVPVMLVLSLGSSLGWLSVTVAGLVALAVLTLVVFIRHERHAPAPMIDLALFRIRSFWLGITTGWQIYLVTFGVMFVAPYLLEIGLGHSAAEAGLELLAMPLAIGLAAPPAGRLADRVGARPLLLIGLGVSTVGLVVMAFLHGSLSWMIMGLAVTGAGLGCATATNNADTMGAVPPDSSGVGSGLLNMARSLGTATGLALTSVVFTIFATAHPVSATLVRTGFRYTAMMLAFVSALAFAASLLLRENGALNHGPAVARHAAGGR